MSERDWAAKATELVEVMRDMDEVDRIPFLSGALRGVRDVERLHLAKEKPIVTMEAPPGFRKEALRVNVGGISWWLDMPDCIATALRSAAAVPAGCVRDDNGVVRKVLGTLPVTADNMIAGSAASLWWLDHTTVVQHVSVLPIRVDDCYSTREAAQAALAAREGGR